MFPLIFLLILFLSSCQNLQTKLYRCLDCHKEYQILTHKDLPCSSCHKGKAPAKNMKEAHQGLIKSLSLDEIRKLCKRCHEKEVYAFERTNHFTYKQELKKISEGFGVRLKAETMFELGSLEEPLNSREGLLLDFLKRRCLSCHIFTQGENYPRTRRDLYCFSCHGAHTLKKPDDESCLRCHYSTYIGWDYYGYSPHPWFVDYRAPFINGKVPERPYGIEGYHLKEDVHKERGMKCLRCHPKEEIMEGKRGISCKSCHKRFKSKGFHEEKVLSKVRCEVCHAGFLNQDELKVCYLEMAPDLAEWLDLSTQESSEIEEIFKAYERGEKVRVVLKDKFSGKEKEGLWLCTLGNRTFQILQLGLDKKKRICIKRREKIRLIYGKLTLEGKMEACKVPHTTGRADLNRSLEILGRLKIR